MLNLKLIFQFNSQIIANYLMNFNQILKLFIQYLTFVIIKSLSFITLLNFISCQIQNMEQNFYLKIHTIILFLKS